MLHAGLNFERVLSHGCGPSYKKAQFLYLPVPFLTPVPDTPSPIPPPPQEAAIFSSLQRWKKLNPETSDNQPCQRLGFDPSWLLNFCCLRLSSPRPGNLKWANWKLIFRGRMRGSRREAGCATVLSEVANHTLGGESLKIKLERGLSRWLHLSCIFSRSSVPFVK